MTKEQLIRRIRAAAGEEPADLVIKNARIVDVYNARILDGDIAIADGVIAGIGSYSCDHEIDAAGAYVAPGLIDSHIHIESSYVSPEEMGRMVVPRGTTTIIADPHEIVNVRGMDGFNYMLEAAEGTALDIRYMMPSCVPATPFEHNGATIDAAAMEVPIQDPRVPGLGEFMDYPGVVHCVESAIDKLMTAHKAGKIIDGHSPGLSGAALNAYVSAGIRTDHECSSREEMLERLSLGMYVLLREGSACHDLRTLVKAVTPANSRRCLLCSDDRQPETIFSEGHIDHHLRLCVEEGLSPFTAIQMATLNAAEAYGLRDRGAVAPGLRADLVFFEDLTHFSVSKVLIGGVLCAENGRYLPDTRRCDSSAMRSSFHIKDFTRERLKLHLNSSRVHIIDIQPGGVVTGKGTADIVLTPDGDLDPRRNPDIVKLAVIERHHATGHMAAALLRGYGIRRGAAAVSIAHDSHNIIAAGVSDEEIYAAVQALIQQEGGIVLVQDEKVLASMPMPIGGIMSDRTGACVSRQLTDLRSAAFDILGIRKDIDPIMTLCFMSLPVIPELKLTDLGLFDVTDFHFIPIEA